eukprot:1194329-Prorocentrum_minimum.AAC.7
MQEEQKLKAIKASKRWFGKKKVVLERLDEQDKTCSNGDNDKAYQQWMSQVSQGGVSIITTGDPAKDRELYQVEHDRDLGLI